MTFVMTNWQMCCGVNHTVGSSSLPTACVLEAAGWTDVDEGSIAYFTAHAPLSGHLLAI
jgi:hypothetical protein